MKILVLNGSPTGEKSITLQYTYYLQQIHKEHAIEIVNVAQQIKKIEEDKNFFHSIMEKVNQADAVIWSFPVYVYLVPAQLKRFIELIWERNAQQNFAGKHAIAISTSIHFYDTLAQHYMQGIMDDMNMHFAGKYSARMGDLLEEDERKHFDIFINDFLETVEKKENTVKHYAQVKCDAITYVSEVVNRTVDLQGKKAVIIYDANDEASNLTKMVRKLESLYVGDVTVINLWDVKINGGCLGCMKCALDNDCVYGQSDDIAYIYDRQIANADIVIYGVTIKDRFLSARFKMFMDRRFRKTHQPQLVGKQLGVMVQGTLSQLNDLDWFFQAEAEMGDGNLAAIMSDEVSDSRELDEMIECFARKLVTLSQNNYMSPRSFAGVAGKKIFRDDIWGELRFVFQKDHDYYTKNGWYDFPQYDKKVKKTNSIMMKVTKIPKVREVMREQMRDKMLEPYQAFLKTLK